VRVVVTGGAGFVGSHLCDALLERGDEVVAVDNLCTGNVDNIAHLRDEPRFQLIKADITEAVPVDGKVDAILNFASPASPPRYLALPLETLRTASFGTERVLDLASRHGARVVHASTSEVYGDPAEHPQPETYWGNVNPHGPRSVYDEAKRYAEALVFAYRRAHGVDAALVRIFNTYGPRLDPHDGRVVSNFLRQALTGEPLTVYGAGDQTRSFCYVSDLIAGVVAMLDSSEVGPVNLGNPAEFTMLELVEVVKEVTGSTSPVEFAPLPEDDPRQRQPDIALARELLGWEPKVPLREGLALTAAWFRERL
jgi:nucleoside-diphosphate-sugar epimerase